MCEKEKNTLEEGFPIVGISYGKIYGVKKEENTVI